jgi:hypothetical protein
MRGNIAAIVLILLGSYFLLSNLGLINVSMREIIATWWPAVLIAVGVSMFVLPGGKR